MNEEYLQLLYSIDHYFLRKNALIIEWKNGLRVRGTSFTGICETDTEPDDEDYIGEYAAAVSDVKVLQQGTDNSVEIYNDCIEISLKCVPERVCNRFGKVLWERKNLKQI